MTTSIVFAGLTLATFAAVPESPYGIHVHMQDRDYPMMEKIFDIVRDIGLGHVRTDCYWRPLQPVENGPFDFKVVEDVVDCGVRHGVATEFILYAAPKWAHPEWKHPEAYRNYVRTTIEKLGDRIKHVEIHNEMNASCFWHGRPDPVAYVAHLKIAYETVKSVRPEIGVALGGVAGCDAAAEFLEGVYEAGGKDYFDEMNVHPYVCPNPPEGNFDGQLERLKALMRRYGDGDKPIIITETGFPTHKASDIPMEMIGKGLKYADPTKKTWNVVIVQVCDELCSFTQDFARHFEKFLPGSKAECCRPREVCERLAAGGVDVVVNPFTEGYFTETVEPIIEFVKNGGTLVDFGGMPMYFAERCTGKGSAPLLDYSAKPEEVRKRLRIGTTAHWVENRVPRKVPCVVAPAGVEAGITLPGGSFVCEYFLTPKLLKEGDEFVPLVEGKAKDGSPLYAAALIRFNNDYKGKLLLSSMNHEAGVPYQPVDEARQALYLSREMGLAMAEGIKRIFWFDLRAREVLPGYNEHHFGIAHKDLSPKPALHAYKAFVARRPAGSVQFAAPWKDVEEGVYFPQWTLPDGTAAGMIWSTAVTKEKTVAFTGDDMKFYDIFGQPISSVKDGARRWRLAIGESPIYFAGGRLDDLSGKMN